MDKIKEQITKIVVFKSTTLDAISEEFDAIKDRLIEGIDKMKQARIFSDTEIKEMHEYGSKLLGAAYKEHRDQLVQNLRKSFEF